MWIRTKQLSRGNSSRNIKVEMSQYYQLRWETIENITLGP